MDNVAPRLPTVLGSSAGLVVAGVGFLVQLPPQACAMRAVAAFMVFAAFGIVIRFLLGDSPLEAGRRDLAVSEHQIVPGTSVEELLAVEEEKHRKLQD
jgi:hypothetical protein